ncbi:MAG: hypothetical protein U0T36_07030 [Saprospiraceae bacterium]
MRLGHRYTSPSPALKHKVFALMYAPYGVNVDKKPFVSDVDTIQWINIYWCDLPDAQFISIFVHTLDENFICWVPMVLGFLLQWMVANTGHLTT